MIDRVDDHHESNESVVNQRKRLYHMIDNNRNASILRGWTWSQSSML